ncbi:MAG: hypothetical protein AAGA56_16885, partial [Myxococcota bacterium]
VVEGLDPRSLVLVDLPRESDLTPPRVFVYAINVLRTAPGLHDVQSVIAEAVRQELAAISTPSSAPLN